jgi:tetratricopeptide (TPR) repeat protein
LKDHASALRAELRSAIDQLNNGKAAEVLPSLVEVTDKLRQEHKDWRALSEALLALGACHVELRNLDEAEGCLLEGLALQEGQPSSQPSVFLHELSMLAGKRGDFEKARILAKAAINAHLGKPLVEARSGLVDYAYLDLIPAGAILNHIAIIDQHTGDFDHAVESLRFSRAIAERSGDLGLLGKTLNELGLSLISAKRFADGISALVEAIRIKLISNGYGVQVTLQNIQVCLHANPEMLLDVRVQAHLQKLQRLARR